MESRHPAFWAGHTFSVVTGTAFVISATLNALTFWLFWKLNYFLIASPADVVMSGFILVAAFAVVASVIALVWRGVVAARRALRADNERRAKDDADKAALVEKYIQELAGRLGKANLSAEEIYEVIRSQRENKEREFDESRRTVDFVHIARSSFTLIVGVCVAMLSSEVISIRGYFDGNEQKEATKPKGQVKMGPWWYATGLQVAPEYTEFNGKCANAPVAWLGSSTAILECSDRVRVIHKLDDLVTVQRYAR